MTLEEKVRKVRAELSLTGEAFDGLEAALMTEMFATSPEQTLKRDKVFFAIKSLRAVRNALIKAVADGEAIVNYTTILAEQGLTSPNV